MPTQPTENADAATTTQKKLRTVFPRDAVRMDHPPGRTERSGAPFAWRSYRHSGAPAEAAAPDAQVLRRSAAAMIVRLSRRVVMAGGSDRRGGLVYSAAPRGRCPACRDAARASGGPHRGGA